jgi:hypothetical protein
LVYLENVLGIVHARDFKNRERHTHIYTHRHTEKILFVKIQTRFSIRVIVEGGKRRSTIGNKFFGLAFIISTHRLSLHTFVNVRWAPGAKSFCFIILGLAKVNRGNS